MNRNIVTLLKKGSTNADGTLGGTIDDLAYTYKTNANQLRKVTDGVAGSLGHNKHFISASASDYSYDQNGNATFVPNKSATITYNHLNLPKDISVAGQGTISYLYDASGNKLKKSFGSSVSYYQGSVLLTGGKVIVMNGEGRSVKNGDSWDYEYDLKDHLGNTRISFLADNSQVSVLQVKDYYPFGMEMTNGQSVAGDPTKYLYNGKELQDEAGLDFYDYGARFYDPTLGRWHSVDPLAEISRRWNPYTYGKDNPLRFIDPDGMGDEDKVKKTEPLKFDLKEIATEALSSVGLNIKAPGGSTTEKLKETKAHNEKQAEIRKEIKGAAKKEVGKVADATETIGTGMQAAGYAAAPFTAGESLVLVGAGKAVENTGSVINGMLDLSEGNYGKVAGKVMTGAALGTLGNKVEAMKNAGKLSNESSGILQFTIDAYEKTVNTIIDAVSEKNNDKKK